MPSSPLLQQLDTFKIPFPRYESIITGLKGLLPIENSHDVSKPEHPLEKELAEREAGIKQQLHVGLETNMSVQNCDQHLPDLQDLEETADLNIEKEKLGFSHPCSIALL